MVVRKLRDLPLEDLLPEMRPDLHPEVSIQQQNPPTTMGTAYIQNPLLLTMSMQRAHFLET